MLCLTVLLCTLPVLLLCMIQCNERCTTASQENNQFAFCDVPLHRIFLYTSNLDSIVLCAWLGFYEDQSTSEEQKKWPDSFEHRETEVDKDQKTMLMR